MRIAVISDIHGNYYALSSVLRDIMQSEVDEIYCLGDIVSIGHQTNKVMDALKNIENMKFVRGNHDLEVIKACKGEKSFVTGTEHDHHLYIARQIRAENLKMLEELPLTVTLEKYGNKILMTHYHLTEESMYQSIDYEPTLASLENNYNNSEYNIILFGHDHMSLHFENMEKLFVNPGALGVTVNEFSPYTIMDIDTDGSIDLEFKQVPYDRKSFIKELKDENPPALDFILKVLLKEEGE